MELLHEFNHKLNIVQTYLDKKGLDGLVLNRTDSFAWMTCGGSNYVHAAAETGVSSLIIADGKVTMLTNKIEEARLRDEELSGLPIEITALPWSSGQEAFAAGKLTGKRIAADSQFAGFNLLESDFKKLMYTLTENELIRYRILGHKTGTALQETCKNLKPGMTENQIAGRLARNCLDRGVFPVVLLVAADERLLRYRHPLPSENKFEHTVMVVVCGKRNGLVASCTRMVSVGEPSPELMDRHAACVLVDIYFNGNTRPGMKVGDIFKTGREAYKSAGFESEWELHHQGGPAGYSPRYFIATDDCEEIVAANSAFAWNPSITGTKSEDTILVLEDRNEFITSAPNWPQIELDSGDFKINRPDIYVI